MPEDRRAAVIGGGPAGLAAALGLAEAGVPVLLVEAEAVLGGRPREFGCVATDRCAVCSACLVLQMVRDAEKSPLIEVLTGTRVTGLSGSPSNRVLDIGDRREPVAGVVVTAGYQPADLTAVRHEYGLGKVAGVSTVLELEARYRSGALAAEPPESIAFVQCAGSRDRSIGRDYCSRVCCTYALRLARAIHHRVPSVQMTVFYQDLTPAGSSFGELADECAGFARLVRALPAKVYEAPGRGRPVVCYADTLQSAGQVEEDFAEVALSVGIWAPGESELDRAFELERDEHGFYRGSTFNRVLVAGTCRGPMDIAESIADGRVAAAELARRLGRSRKGSIALVGGGRRVAALARRLGQTPVAASSVRGAAGAFVAETDQGPVPVTGVVVCATTPDAVAAGALPPNMSSLWNPNTIERARKVRLLAILPDLVAPWSRVAHEAALALAASRHGERRRTWILARHAFTGEMGLEQLMTKAREAGTIFVCTPVPPVVEHGAVRFVDPALGQEFTQRVDLVVAAPALAPSSEQVAIIRRLGLTADGDTRPAPLNPHTGLAGTRRRGIEVAGWVRDETSSRESAARAVEAALSAPLIAPTPGTAEVDAAKCAICLTCIRACPHSAALIAHDDERDKDVSRIEPEACAGCGLCVTLCPAGAIELREQPDEAVVAALEA